MITWIYQVQTPVPVDSVGPIFGWFEFGHGAGRYGNPYEYYPPYVYETRDVLRLTFDERRAGLIRIERID